MDRIQHLGCRLYNNQTAQINGEDSNETWKVTHMNYARNLQTNLIKYEKITRFRIHSRSTCLCNVFLTVSGAICRKEDYCSYSGMLCDSNEVERGDKVLSHATPN